MSGYNRNDVTDQIANGNIIDAFPLDGEFDAIQNAFAATGGHSHGGGIGEGAPITVIGPAQNVIASSNSLTPKTHNATDLGTTSYRWRDLFLEGVARIKSLIADLVEIKGGTIDNTEIGETTPSTIKGTTITADNFVGPISGTVTGDVAGNAATTTKLQTARTVALTGDVTGSVSFDGSSNVAIASTVVNNSHSHTLSTITDAGSIASQDSNSVSITGGSIAGITDLAVKDGGTGASNASGARSNLGLGSVSTQNSNSVSITGGSISGITDLAVADGGTGASNAAGARANLGLTTQTSSTDDSSGRVLTVGAFGLGGKSDPVTDLDTLTGTYAGFKFNEYTPGAPVLSGNYDAIGWQVDVSGQITQFASAGGNDLLLARINDSGTWSPWVKYINELHRATVDEARTGIDDEKFVTPLGIEEHMKANTLGRGQFWRDVSAYRSVDTIYHNATTRPIMVSVSGDGNTSEHMRIEVSSDGVSWVVVAGSSSSYFTGIYSMTTVVPYQNYYRVYAGDRIISWSELS